MKISGEKGLGSFLKSFLQVCLCFGIVAVVVIPFVLQEIGFNLNASLFIIWPNGLVLAIITHQFIKLFDSLKHNNPFCYENVKTFKVTGIVALIGSIFWLLDLLYEIILAKSADIVFISILAFLSILFLGVSIALYILSELFKEATEYKLENELTI